MSLLDRRKEVNHDGEWMPSQLILRTDILLS
jgi:hypothetical protein